MYKRELWPYSGVAKGGQRGLEHPFFSCALAVIKPTAYPRKLVVYVFVTHLRLARTITNIGVICTCSSKNDYHACMWMHIHSSLGLTSMIVTHFTCSRSFRCNCIQTRRRSLKSQINRYIADSDKPPSK